VYGAGVVIDKRCRHVARHDVAACEWKRHWNGKWNGSDTGLPKRVSTRRRRRRLLSQTAAGGTHPLKLAAILQNVAVSVFDRNKRRKAEINEALKQESARREADRQILGASWVPLRTRNTALMSLKMHGVASQHCALETFYPELLNRGPQADIWLSLRVTVQAERNFWSGESRKSSETLGGERTGNDRVRVNVGMQNACAVSPLGQQVGYPV
jgi:hypothetical protein